MKKEDVASLFIYVIIIATAIIFGVTVLQERASATHMSQGEYIGYIILAIATGVIFNAIMFEVAHILGAKLGGYSILLVNVLGFTFYKKEEKFKFKFSSSSILSSFLMKFISLLYI